ncbi:uncharacterized protein LOC112906610 isoform X2 [Agrilus planipennis]|nr:uncharacterized protein LOC112906610 isoform X2 [Agrilus planipennis]XP_025836837.1 uncharacterized protein LOC112906610 isoform X2 [Agrilus planipennis]
MSTLQFKGESPYKLPPPTVPEDDYLYIKFNKDFNLEGCEEGKPVGLALFGAGRAGTIHLRTIAKNVRVKLHYIVEDVQEKWDKLKRYWDLPDTVFLTSVEADKVYKDLRVDAVVIATPTKYHEGIVLKALEHGKAVFCEKPIGLTAEGTKKCYEKAKKVGKPLFAAFNKRYDTAYAAVKRRVEQGEVGHLRMFKASVKDSQLAPVSYLKGSGGFFVDSVIHELDLMVWFVGEYPTTVSAIGKSNIPEIEEIGDYDTVVATFGFPSGAIGIIDNCRHSTFGYDQRIEVFGSKGMIKVDNEHPCHSIETLAGLDATKRSPIWYTFPSRYRNAYNNEMEHFLSICQGIDKVLISESDVLATSRIAGACTESARTGKIVTLKW